MGEAKRIWLINNEASGSNDADALLACEHACDDNSLHIAQRTTFPAQELPSPELLDAAEIEIVVVYAGDGTINSALQALAGWDGAVLVLPGGTMNLLYHRLFGDADLEDAVTAVSQGNAFTRNPGIITSNCGTAYAGILAGPGTEWANVREAMRDVAPLEMAGEARRAFAETVWGQRLRCAEPNFGTREGYPLILLNPRDHGIEADAYHAESAAEFTEQLFAIVRRDFREGPHDRLGSADRFVLESVDGAGFGILFDGEPCDADGATEFVLEPAKVNLLATLADD